MEIDAHLRPSQRQYAIMKIMAQSESTWDETEVALKGALKLSRMHLHRHLVEMVEKKLVTKSVDGSSVNWKLTARARQLLEGGDVSKPSPEDATRRSIADRAVYLPLYMLTDFADSEKPEAIDSIMVDRMFLPTHLDITKMLAVIDESNVWVLTPSHADIPGPRLGIGQRVVGRLLLHITRTGF